MRRLGSEGDGLELRNAKAVEIHISIDCKNMLPENSGRINCLEFNALLPTYMDSWQSKASSHALLAIIGRMRRIDHEPWVKASVLMLPKLMTPWPPPTIIFSGPSFSFLPVT